MKLIVDVDPGFDDAMALGVAFTWPNTDVLAVTCVNGNVNLDQTCKNALKIRKLFNRDDVPVHKGAKTPILDQHGYEASFWHGFDGLLGCMDQVEADLTQLADQHAANCIVDLATQNKGEISIVALGPLTNLALAIRLQPELPKYLKEVIILGGNHTGVGNVTASAEFNFAVDPIAAHIVLKEYDCPLIVVPWETVTHTPFSEEFNVEYCNKDNERSRAFKLVIEEHISRHNLRKFDSADTLAMCVALDRDTVIAEAMDVYATVEPHGEHTHGMMVVDKRRYRGKPPSNVKLITKVNIPEIEKMLIHSVSS
eukprot:gene14211-15694_t